MTRTYFFLVAALVWLVLTILYTVFFASGDMSGDQTTTIYAASTVSLLALFALNKMAYSLKRGGRSVAETSDTNIGPFGGICAASVNSMKAAAGVALLLPPLTASMILHPYAFTAALIFFLSAFGLWPMLVLPTSHTSPNEVPQ